MSWEPEKILIDLFDYTGNAAQPYRENGWNVLQWDIQHGKDVFDFSPSKVLLDHKIGKLIIIAAIPCTDYALSGAKHFARKDADGTTAQSQKLVTKVKSIIDFFDEHKILDQWVIENPMSRIHKLNPWLGSPVQKFDPCDFAGYDPVPDNSRYNKKTWLWGRFNKIEPKRMEPLSKEYPGFKNLGGKSLATKNARSASPLGFCYGFYEFNH